MRQADQCPHNLPIPGEARIKLALLQIVPIIRRGAFDMSKQDDLKEGHWFVKLLMDFAPDIENIEVTGTPEEMTQTASWKAFSISTAAAVPPGPFGLVTILPEIVAVTKIQMNLLYRIAKYHQQAGKVNRTLVLLIFGNALGFAVGSEFFRKVGSRLLVESAGSPGVRNIALRIGKKITTRILPKTVARWVPFVLAPIFGAFSKSMTTKIGREANKIFRQDIAIEKPGPGVNGHGELVAE